MSTVYGIFNRKKKVIEGIHIQLMDDALAYWKTDDKGNWNESSVFLGHRMLWNTPESKLEHLPRVISSENQTFVITIDVRLDNRETLAEQLKMTALPLGKITDSELVLAAYQKWGEECPKYLLGDFVFVIWDEHKEQLFCARDHIGVKPFYYYLSDDLFVFSNDIRGVIAHPDIEKKYNDKSIAMFLSVGSGFYDEKDTFFEVIQKLPAATSMTISKEQVSKSVYWDIEDISEIHYATYEEYVEKLRELLFDAVKVRLRTVYPVASHLSGGLDSSSIAVLAARELKKRKQSLYSFNWVETPKEDYDPTYCEWGFATQLVNLENIEQKDLRITPEFYAEMYDKVDISKDDISFFWSEYLLRDEAVKYDVRSILSGWGGDELISFNGYTYLSGLFRQGHFVKAIKEIAVINKDKKYRHLRTLKRSLRELFHPYVFKRMLKAYEKDVYRSDPFEFAVEPFVSFAKKFSFGDPGIYMGVHNKQKAYFRDGHLLFRIENWASSAIGKKLEYSYPLLDKRIVEFALAIPEEVYASKRGHQRFFFKSAVSDLLPENIVWTEKSLDPKHGKMLLNVWHEALRVWMQKNDKISRTRNCYVDYSKIIDRLKIYYTNKKNGLEDRGVPGIIPSILVSNLKNKGC